MKSIWADCPLTAVSYIWFVAKQPVRKSSLFDAAHVLLENAVCFLGLICSDFFKIQDSYYSVTYND